MTRSLVRALAWTLRVRAARRVVVLTLLVAGLLVFGVGGGGSLLDRLSGAGRARTQPYPTMATLRADADAVVRGVAEPPVAVEDVGGAPFTVTGLRVVDVFRGSLPGSRLLVRQRGRAGAPAAGAPPLLVAGRTYVVFLSRFGGDQYVVTAGTGEFEDRGGGVLARLDPTATGLPATVTLAALRSGLG